MNKDFTWVKRLTMIKVKQTFWQLLKLIFHHCRPAFPFLSSLKFFLQLCRRPPQLLSSRSNLPLSSPFYSNTFQLCVSKYCIELASWSCQWKQQKKFLIIKLNRAVNIYRNLFVQTSSIAFKSHWLCQCR